jgi:hypothetical protein
MTDEQLSALLRLKRYEQPAPQYFDRLLEDIHRRQRSELLHRPLWRIALDRMQTLFSEHSMGHLSYAGALATVLVVGVVGIGFVTSGGSMDRSAQKPFISITHPSSDKPVLQLAQTKQGPVLEPASLSTAQPAYPSASRQPRYVIDARPVSYEPSSAYSF